MPCVRCGSPQAVTFLPDGSPACQPCFYAADTRKKEESAAKNAMASGIVALVVVAPLLLLMTAFIRYAAIGLVGVVSGAIAGIRYAVRTRRAHRLADQEAEMRALQRGR